MKVIIVGPAYPYRGGIADTNESLCRAFIAGGHDALIVTFKIQYPGFLFPGKTQFSEDAEPEEPKVIRMINSINPLNWIITGKRINKLNPDLVIIRYWLPFMSPCLGTVARSLKKSIKVFALCDNIIPHEKRFGDILFTKYFVKPFDGFITMSSKVKEELDQFSNKPKIYIPHPINDNLGEKIPKAEARKHLNLDVSGKYILFFGLVRKYKGLDLLLKSMAEDAVKQMNIKLLVVGEFYDSKEEYQKIINENDLNDRVIIKDEYIPTSDIKYYFSAVDLVAQTYHTASQSGITQIAYNFEVPILVTDVGGLSEMVIHNELGYVTSKETSDIAKYICDIYQTDRFDTFSNNIKKEKTKYTWESFSNKVTDLFDSLKNN